MHIAAALGTPTLSLFAGPSIPHESGASHPGARSLTARLPCLPCARPDQCGIQHACQRDITPAAVLALLDGRDPGPGLQAWRADLRHGLLWQDPAPSPTAQAWLRQFLPHLPPVAAPPHPGLQAKLPLLHQLIG